MFILKHDLPLLGAVTPLIEFMVQDYEVDLNHFEDYDWKIHGSQVRSAVAKQWSSCLTDPLPAELLRWLVVTVQSFQLSTLGSALEEYHVADFRDMLADCFGFSLGLIDEVVPVFTHVFEAFRLTSMKSFTSQVELGFNSTLSKMSLVCKYWKDGIQLVSPTHVDVQRLRSTTGAQPRIDSIWQKVLPPVSGIPQSTSPLSPDRICVLDGCQHVARSGMAACCSEHKRRHLRHIHALAWPAARRTRGLNFQDDTALHKVERLCRQSKNAVERSKRRSNFVSPDFRSGSTEPGN